MSAVLFYSLSACPIKHCYIYMGRSSVYLTSSIGLIIYPTLTKVVLLHFTRASSSSFLIPVRNCLKFECPLENKFKAMEEVFKIIMC